MERTITVNGKQLGKEDVYLDLSKLSVWGIKNIGEILKNEDVYFETMKELKSGYFGNCNALHLSDGQQWINQPLLYHQPSGKTEITYSQFLELMGETKQPKYRFKTLDEFDKEFYKDRVGDYIVGRRIYFFEAMFHLAGMSIPDEFSEQIMNNPNGIFLDLQDIVKGKDNKWWFALEMLTLNEPENAQAEQFGNSEQLEKAKKLLEETGYAVFPLDENGIPDLSDWKGVEMLVSDIGRNYWLKDFIKAKIGENKFLTKHCLDAVEVRPIQPDLTPEEIVEKLGKEYLLKLIKENENS